MPKLNLGCGNEIRPGWINLDRKGLPGVDVVHDLETLPLPFPADTFDYILCQDVLEHVNCVALLREILRIMRDEGILHIRVPHFTCTHAYGDPTRLFSIFWSGGFIQDESLAWSKNGFGRCDGA